MLARSAYRCCRIASHVVRAFLAQSPPCAAPLTCYLNEKGPMNRSESVDVASVESILDDLQQFEEEEQSGCAELQGASDLLSDAEGSVASEASAVMPIVDLFSV
jgi:hypothetical protein